MQWFNNFLNLIQGDTEELVFNKKIKQTFEPFNFPPIVSFFRVDTELIDETRLELFKVK